MTENLLPVKQSHIFSNSPANEVSMVERLVYSLSILYEKQCTL